MEIGRFGLSTSIANYGTLKSSCVTVASVGGGGGTVVNAPVRLQRWVAGAWSNVATLYSIPDANNTDISSFQTHSIALSGGTVYRIVILALADQPTAVAGVSVTIDIECSLR
jgi:hypothetical protein